LNERKQLETLKFGTRMMVLDQHRSKKWKLIYEGQYEVVRYNQSGAYVLKDKLGEIMESKRTIEMLKLTEMKIQQKRIIERAMRLRIYWTID
jgi:hypothetical protein